jgi:hypothetical protein
MKLQPASFFLVFHNTLHQQQRSCQKTFWVSILARDLGRGVCARALVPLLPSPRPFACCLPRRRRLRQGLPPLHPTFPRKDGDPAFFLNVHYNWV